MRKLLLFVAIIAAALGTFSAPSGAQGDVCASWPANTRLINQDGQRESVLIPVVIADGSYTVTIISHDETHITAPLLVQEEEQYNVVDQAGNVIAGPTTDLPPSAIEVTDTFFDVQVSSVTGVRAVHVGGNSTNSVDPRQVCFSPTFVETTTTTEPVAVPTTTTEPVAVPATTTGPVAVTTTTTAAPEVPQTTVVEPLEELALTGTSQTLVGISAGLVALIIGALALLWSRLQDS